jgi:hypothetical protein
VVSVSRGFGRRLTPCRTYLSRIATWTIHATPQDSGRLSIYCKSLHLCIRQARPFAGPGDPDSPDRPALSPSHFTGTSPGLITMITEGTVRCAASTPSWKSRFGPARLGRLDNDPFTSRLNSRASNQAEPGLRRAKPIVRAT